MNTQRELIETNKQIYFDYSSILQRNHIKEEIISILQLFDSKYCDVQYKKGIYIYGSPGSGKTHFVVHLLKEIGYDVIKYDAGDVRNKSLIDNITSNNISNKNVLDMMHGKTKKIAIVMDEIDGMNNGDKGGINALIKLIRQKKTQKQKLENMTLNPIICIGNYYMDKKIRELMKVCNCFELKTPTNEQIEKLLCKMIPNEHLLLYKDSMIQYIQGDIRKLNFTEQLYRNKSHLLTNDIIQNIFHNKTYNEDSKRLTSTLFNEYIPFDEHNIRMNDNDRTIIALLWHENIVDLLEHIPKECQYMFYMKLLQNICFADYIDRITFQNQIWIFNEMSSLIKTFYNNKLYHDAKFDKKTIHHENIRFTKVLTKYSTEYNNQLFLTNLSLELNLDTKDLIAFFQELRTQLERDCEGDFMNDANNIQSIEELFEGYEISKLDVKRMYRFLDKNVKKDALIEEDE
jgi:DNA polymerase III delta prime subunit